MHGGGEAVVGALRRVDVVIGVHRPFAAAALAGQLVGAAGDHLVDVHVALRAAAGLPDPQGELRVMLAGENLIGDLFDQLADLGAEAAVALVDAGGGFFDQAQGVNHRQRHDLLTAGEIAQGALGLGAPVRLGRDLDRPEAVGFNPVHGAAPAAVGWLPV